MSTNSLNLKVLRVRENDRVFIMINPSNIVTLIDNQICLNALRITPEEAYEILNLKKIDNTLAFIHFNQLWEKYHEIENL